ncbi:nuclear transport factor 2 family protein [Nocardioides sp.]|jgi:hypothetical protein|uniref:nuclear transport factor 2 family protein n=1 Tax=Nocardioides sp. TaxID=35761 RepID=UPI002A013738|nr:ring hydroxylating subunit beta family [Nocardioides sp.]MCW2795717.1 ring hydroxylating subunit beta family [Nocardioides sp.]
MQTDPEVRRSLLDLHAAYAFSIDSGDADAFADCFTPDGVLETTRPLVVTGRDELVAFAHDRARHAADPCRHLTWHHTFAGGPDQVEGRCSAAVLQTTSAGVQVLFTATYVDWFVQSGEKWRLLRRFVAMDLPGADVPD